MNDFTKDELEIILLDMKSYIHRTPILVESPSHKALRKKIELMINNYCDPKSINAHSDCPPGCKMCN